MSKKIIINGGKKLNGEISLPGAKNAALPILVASAINSSQVTLKNFPADFADVKLLKRILEELGVNIEIKDSSTINVLGKNFKGGDISPDASMLRHSLLILGLAAYNKVDTFLPIPGGCSIGNRKFDLHIYGLRELGFDVQELPEGIALKQGELNKNATIKFHYPTFGGTINVILAALGIEGGHTLIQNAAKNPEVQDMISMISKIGGRINWVNDTDIEVFGGLSNTPITHEIMGDRIIAATITAAAILTKGEVEITGCSPVYLETELGVWERAGAGIERKENGFRAFYNGRMKATDVETRAYPGFHTDIQPIHAALMALAEGKSTLKETILDGRFLYVEEINKMGTNIQVHDGDFICVNGKPGQYITIEGVETIHPANIKATDIRGGAAMLLCALAANGVSEITNIYQIERGYGDVTKLFSPIGADIRIVEESLQEA